MSGPIQIDDLRAADVPAVALMQVRILLDSLVTQLGEAFVKRFLQATLSHPGTVALVAREGLRLAGFCVSTFDVHGFRRHVQPRVLLPLTTALLLRPRLAPKFVRSVFEPEPVPQIPAELLLLVVDDLHQRGGIGRKLLAGWEHRLAASAPGRYRVAVRSHLAGALAFYAACGFRFEQELRVLGAPMTYLVRELATPARREP